MSRTILYWSAGGAIIVNKEGQRFVNESINYKAYLAQPGAIGFQIYDSSIRDYAKSDALSPIDALEEKGFIYQADTIAELAKLIGIDPATLEQTAAKYNSSVAVGVDPDFGRTTLNAASGVPRPIEKAPFYAFPSTGVIFGTYGGVLIDTKARVVDIFGDVIPGLFAAGEVTGGLHGAGYMTGTAVGKAVVFGRIAGESVVQ
jgi:fumarate reductase flavoprotein subunit